MSGCNSTYTQTTNIEIKSINLIPHIISHIRTNERVRCILPVSIFCYFWALSVIKHALRDTRILMRSEMMDNCLKLILSWIYEEKMIESEM